MEAVVLPEPPLPKKVTSLMGLASPALFTAALAAAIVRITAPFLLAFDLFLV